MNLQRSFVCPWVLVSAVQRESLAFRSHHCQSIEKSCSVPNGHCFRIVWQGTVPNLPTRNTRSLPPTSPTLGDCSTSKSCLAQLCPCWRSGLRAAHPLRGELPSRCWQLGDLWGMTPPSFGFVSSFVPQKACLSPYCNLSVTRRLGATLCFVFTPSMRRRYVSFVCASRWYGSVTLCMAVHTCYLSFFIFDLVCRNRVKNWHASSSIWPFSVSSLFRQQSATPSVLLLQMAVKSSRSSVSRPLWSGQLCRWMAPLLWSVRGSNLHLQGHGGARAMSMSWSKPMATNTPDLNQISFTLWTRFILMAMRRPAPAIHVPLFQTCD